MVGTNNCSLICQTMSAGFSTFPIRLLPGFAGPVPPPLLINVLYEIVSAIITNQPSNVKRLFLIPTILTDFNTPETAKAMPVGIASTSTVILYGMGHRIATCHFFDTACQAQVTIFSRIIRLAAFRCHDHFVTTMWAKVTARANFTKARRSANGATCFHVITSLNTRMDGWYMIGEEIAVDDRAIAECDAQTVPFIYFLQSR